MNKPKLSQKEYLKKYLSGDISQTEKVKKKKKKVKSVHKPTVTIVDDDFDLSKLANVTEEDLDNYNLGEDLPQIAGIIDERPAELIAKEDYKSSGKWKSMGEENTDLMKVGQKMNKFTEFDERTSRKISNDASPPRKSRRSSDASPPRKSRWSPDASPPRKSRRSPDASPPRKSRRSPDASPPRRSKRSPDLSFQKRKKRSPDASPPRRSRRSPHTSPPRRSKRSPDLSLPKRARRSSSTSPPRKVNRNSDASPPRRPKRSPDASPPRRSKRSPDSSYQKRRNRSPDASPPRRSKQSPRRSNRSLDLSPPRRSKRSRSPQKSSQSTIKKPSDSPPPTHKKMLKTLDGKAAGLQNATALREENEQFKKREDDMFKKMAEKHRYDDNNTVRDRKTGRRGNLREESEKEREKLRKEEERKQVYDVWGKGVKQIEEYKSRVQSETHEMNKPVARYANDEDLEEYLKNQSRDEDPMAEYFRNKRKQTQSGPSKPVYQGSFPENRFNIRPGYRWDGVDRSNGYEKKWFETQSRKKASEEEAYKYSVEDM